MMDERVEAFLPDILALEGEDVNAIREGVRGALADYEQLVRAQDSRKHCDRTFGRAMAELSEDRLNRTRDMERL
jgi:hypothetical protein